MVSESKINQPTKQTTLKKKCVPARGTHIHVYVHGQAHAAMRFFSGHCNHGWLYLIYYDYISGEGSKIS